MNVKKLLMCGAVVALMCGGFASCSDDEPDTPKASWYTGTFVGDNTVTVGGQYSYTAVDQNYVLTEAKDGTVTVSIPEYSLSGTIMGDLTVGAITVSGLQYDAATGTYTKDYGSDGLTIHFKAVAGGQTSMDADYPINAGSTLTVAKDGENRIKVTNSFRLGKMPFPLVAVFTGAK